MIYQSLHNLIRDTIGAIGTNVFFYHGKDSNFNSEQKETYPLAWLDIVTTSSTFINDNRTNDSHAVKLIFLDLDKVGADSTTSNSIVFQMDKLARKFIIDLNNKLVDLSDSAYASEITNVRITPFVKVKASVLTGVLLEFTLTCPDNVEYC